VKFGLNLVSIRFGRAYLNACPTHFQFSVTVTSNGRVMLFRRAEPCRLCAGIECGASDGSTVSTRKQCRGTVFSFPRARGRSPRAVRAELERPETGTVTSGRTVFGVETREFERVVLHACPRRSLAGRESSSRFVCRFARTQRLSRPLDGRAAS